MLCLHRAQSGFIKSALPLRGEHKKLQATTHSIISITPPKSSMKPCIGWEVYFDVLVSQHSRQQS
eukprot:4153493-Amphidinium_carterae.5